MNISKINTGTLDNREYILMKNRREELITIPKFYITSYTPKLDDVSEMVLEIPNFIEHQGQQIKYPLYDYVQAKRHIVIKKDDQALERFVIESIETSNEKGKKKKKVVARSYENILKNKTCLINEGVTRQLYKPEDETFDVEDGILNMFEQQTGWTVAHIDEQARKEVVESNISVTMDVASENTYEKVEKDTVLLDVDVNVPAEDGFALNFDLSWKDLVITTTDDTSFEAGSIVHTFVDLPCGVTHLKATFTSNAEQRYGMTYELTLTDETVKKVTYAFVNCRNMKLVSKGNSLTYITSQIEEKTVTKYRFLEHSSGFWYQYLKTTIQEAFNCYIFFDSYNKTISVYDKPSKQEWKGFHLDFDNLLTKVTKTQKISDLCTRLWIQSNNVDITEVNPLGTSYIEDYSYFIESGTMSNELKSALERYYVQIELLQEQWLELKKQKDIASQWLTKRNSELVSINEQVKAKNALLTAYIKAGDNEEGQKRVAQELTELENQASAKLAEVDELKEQNDKLATEMQLIGKLMSKEMCEDSQGKIFTTEDLEELTDITIEQTYNDDYHTKAPSLFKYVKELMKDKARLTYDFTLEHKDFVKGIKHPKGWDWFVEVGGRVEIEDKDIADSDGLVTIYSFTYSPKDEKITSVDFSNNSAVIQAVNGLASIGKLVHNTANMTDYWKHTWVEADKATAIVSDIRKNGLDLAANIVRGGSTVNKISMSEAGLFIIDAENENNQIYLGASLMAMTDDKWITSKTAVTTGGVLADSIVGRLILGEKLFISNEDGSFEILPNGLTIRDELGKEQVSLGIDDKKNPFLHLGIKDESKNHLIFNADGTLDIKASSIKLMTGDVVSKEEMEEIANNVANKLDLAIRNYALDTVMHKTLTGNGNNEQVISLYELSQDGTTFMDEEVTLTFKYTTTLESQGSFFVRTGSNHYQALTDVIVIGSETQQGKVAKTVTITKEVGQSFSDLELVARNFTGEITISMLKFSLGNKATDWTPAPEDSDASYSVILTNESQVIPTTTSLKPLSNSQYTTQVIVYQGTKQQTNFKIKPLVAKDGITPSINGDTITFSVNKNTILNANQGQFEIEIEIDNKVFRKMWTWATASQGQDGAIGENAKQVIVTGEQVFKYQNNFTGNPSNLTIRLTATLFHTTGCQWSYRVGSGNPVNISGATNTTLDIQHNASYWGNHKQLVFRCTSNDGVFDEMTVVKVSDGTDGESSYSVFLTNENHSFPCESNGNIPVALETTTNVVVFKGSEKVTPRIGDILKPDGLDVRVEQPVDNEVPIVITALAGNRLGEGGNLAIPIIVGSEEFEKSFTYSKAKSGEKGEDGSNAHYITITGEQFFKYGNEGFTGTPTPSQVVLTAQRTNLTGRGEWQYLDGAIWRNLNVNTDTLTVTPTTGGLAHNSTCSFRFIVDGNYDIMTIAKLSDGANGQDGINGSNAYFYIRYSANADGSNMTSTPQVNTKYMGTCSSTSATAPTNASAYSWSLIKGEDGEQGIKGEDGANGESSYLHVKYSNDGRTFTPNNGEDLGSWIGTYVDNNPMDSSVFSDYNWSKFVGEDGQDGQDGASAKFVIMNGEQAFKYTNNFTGNPTPTSITLATTVYNVNNPTYKWSFKRAGETTWNTISGVTSGNYSLAHNNSTIFNSNNVKSVTLRCTVNNDIFDEMTIVKVSDGANGTNGKDGINGINGQDGVSTYFYVRYSANANGSNMTNTPNANSLYMGTCSTTSQVAPTNPTDYQWTLIKGADGKDGIAGANGSDGRTSYLHIKYSNDGQTFTPNNGEDVGLYIGTYVDFVQADSNNFNDYTWKKFVGEDGEDGLDAYTVILTNETHAFPCASNGNVTNAISINTTAIAYKGATSVTPTIGTLPSVNGLTLSKNGAVVTIQANTGTSLADSGTVNIPVVVDGKTFTKVFSWTKAKSGVNGVNGYTILLDNENFTFQASSTGNITSQIQTTTTATAYQGTVQKTPTIGNLPTVNGLTLTKNGATVTIVAKTGTALAEQGEFAIPIIVDNQTFTRKFTWTKARSGAEAQYVVVNGEQVFKYTDNFSGAPAPSSITLTADKINISTNGKWQYKNANGSWTDWTVDNAVVTATTLTVSPNSHLLNSAKQMSVRYIAGTLYDEITIVKVSDGTNGSNGTNGADAYTVILSNENHTFPCESNGNIPTAINATTNIIAYKGATSVTPTIGNLPSVNGLTLSKSGTTVTIQANTGTALASSGSLTIPVTVDGKNFNKVFSWSKAFKGANGASGSHAKSADIVSTSQVFKSTDGGVTFTPDTITLTPILQNVSFSKWQYSTNGGSSWSNVSNGQNGLTVSGNNLVINKGSALYTTSVTSVTFKLITNDSNIYDTMTIVKLYDVKDMEIGGANVLRNGNFARGMEHWSIHNPSNTGGSNKSVAVIDGDGTWSPIGKKVLQIKGTMTTDRYGVISSTMKLDPKTQYTISGYCAGQRAEKIQINVRDMNSSSANIFTKDLTPVTGGATLDKWHRFELTFKTTSNTDFALNLYSVNFDDNGFVWFCDVQIQKGNKATDWNPCPEDGIDYTDKLIDDLRKLDLKQITDQNQESSDMIANILNDSLIMPHEKTSLKFEFERIKILKENAINYYNTVNDTSFQQLRNAMNTAYTNVENTINPILANMTTTSNASNSAVQTTFGTFYEAYETLMTALQQSVIILATKHSTKLEQLDKEITMTASKAEIMQDKVNQFDAHMRFSADGFVEIFATENGQKGRFSTQITNQKMSFKDNEMEVAYVSNQELNINRAVIKDRMSIGNFAIKPSGSPTGGIVFAYEAEGATTETTVAVTGISVDIVSATLEVGATKQVNANVVPTNASNKNIIWSSSSTGVASVSASGLITAKSGGSCTITAKTSDGGFTKTISVTVKQIQTEAPNPTPPSPTIPVTGIEVDTWDVSLKVGNSKQLNAHVIPRNATNQLIHWHSNNTSVATVTSSGLVQAVGEGYALVTATTDEGGIPYNVHVNVEANRSGGTTPNPPMEDSTIANGSETPIYQQYSTSHEAKPNNPNPASGAYNWNDAPRINPDGAFPQSSWNAIGHWMTSYLVKGASYYDNVAVLLQNPKMWIWNTSTRSWDVLSDDFEWGTWYLEDFWNDGNGNIGNTTLWQTGESANHSKWVKIKQTSETTGRCFHPWGYQKNWRNNSNWSNNGQPYIITKVDFKLVKWDSNGADNLDRARIVVDSGADWWRNVGDTWQSDWSTSRDMAVGKYILATQDLKRAYCTNLPQNWSYGFPTVNDNPNIGEDAPSGGGSTVITEIQVENTTVQKGQKLAITFSSVGSVTSGGGCCLFDSNNTPICTGYFESNSKAVLDTETLGASSYSVFLSASQWDENIWNNKPISPRSNVFTLSVTESSGGNNTPPSGGTPSLSPSSATLNRNQSQTFTIIGATSTIAGRELANSRCSIDGETDNTITITGRVLGSDVLIVTLSDGTQLQAQITIN